MLFLPDIEEQARELRMQKARMASWRIMMERRTLVNSFGFTHDCRTVHPYRKTRDWGSRMLRSRWRPISTVSLFEKNNPE